MDEPVPGDPHAIPGWFDLKGIMAEIRDDVKSLLGSMAILESQDLDHRLTTMESWRQRIDGRMTAFIVVLSVAGSLVTVFAFLRPS